MAVGDKFYTIGDLNGANHCIRFSGRSPGDDVELCKNNGQVVGTPTSGLIIVAGTTEAVTNDVDFKMRIRHNSTPTGTFLGVDSKITVNGVVHPFTEWNGVSSTIMVNNVEVFNDSMNGSEASDWVTIKLPMESLNNLVLDLRLTANAGTGGASFFYEVELDGVTKYISAAQSMGTVSTSTGGVNLTKDITSDFFDNFSAIYSS